jgi:serine/threonine-protein kinase
VAYYLLTGRLAFEGETPLQTILKHLQEPPEPPSRLIETPIPPELETLGLACLAKRPEDRPPSAAALADALAGVAFPSPHP